MEPFLIKEVQARLGATQVEYVLGKVFFTTSAELHTLKKLKSAERLFLLLNKYPPLSISKNKGRVIHDIQKLVNESSRSWLDIITVWKSLHGQEVKPENASQEYLDSQKRKSEEEGSTNNKRQKREQLLKTISAESQVENQERCDTSKADIDSVLSESKLFLEKTYESIQKKLPLASRTYIKTAGLRSTVAWAMASFAEIHAGDFVLDPTCGLGTVLLEAATEWLHSVQSDFASVFLTAKMKKSQKQDKQCCKEAKLEQNIYVGKAKYGVFSRQYYYDPLARNSHGEILASKYGLGLLNAHYLGTDISDSQLQGAYSNIKAAGLLGKIDLLKASVTELPLPPGSINVVFADIPFGKKFKITNDMKLLPDVLQEIERVLCVGGTAVLLLSQELHKRINGSISSGAETENHNSIESTSDYAKCAVISLESKAQEKTGSPLAQGVGKEDISNTKTILGSLVLVQSLEVSLGKTDAFMCKYKKVLASLPSIKS
ncbi:UNVERIFIED_CONTAM: hypothetical protein K2H54_042318 [Gekko kuhli]